MVSAPELVGNFSESAFAKFKQKTVDKISNIDDALITQEEVNAVIDTLIDELKNIPVGATGATRYHHLISGILELLFYPHISHPRIEQEIHEGRKRVDIVFSNTAETGFFFLFCRYLCVIL